MSETTKQATVDITFSPLPSVLDLRSPALQERVQREARAELSRAVAYLAGTFPGEQAPLEVLVLAHGRAFLGRADSRKGLAFSHAPDVTDPERLLDTVGDEIGRLTLDAAERTRILGAEGVTGPSLRELARQRSVQLLREAAQAGTQVSRPLLQAVLPGLLERVRVPAATPITVNARRAS